MTGRWTPPSSGHRPPTLPLPHSDPGSAATSRSKYGNKRTELDGYKFASKKEARRYAELRLLQTGKVIEGLICQPAYPLMIGKVRVGKYIADFAYLEIAGKHRRVVVEDAKGMRTPVFNLKWRMVKALYPELDWRLV